MNTEDYIKLLARVRSLEEEAALTQKKGRGHQTIFWFHISVFAGFIIAYFLRKTGW